VEEHGEVHEAFRLVPAIKAIVQCRSISALKSLKNVIDDRLNELDGIEQNTTFTEQTGVKTEQTGVKTEQKPSKIEQKKKTRYIYDQAVYPEDQIMGRYGTTTVYKPVVDVILEKTTDRFSSVDVAKIIDKHYNFTLERPITAGSARSYASVYIKCMSSKGLIKEDGSIGYLDVIDVTGIVGTIVRENYNDTVNSIEVKSIKMVKKFEWTPPQDDTSKFIGTWILVENSFGMDNHTKDTWIFYENKSAKSTIIHFMEYPEEPNASINIKWIPFEAREGRLYITTQDNSTIWYNYLFSNNDLQLTLSIPGFSTQKYNKTG